MAPLFNYPTFEYLLRLSKNTKNIILEFVTI